MQAVAERTERVQPREKVLTMALDFVNLGEMEREKKAKLATVKDRLWDGKPMRPIPSTLALDFGYHDGKYEAFITCLGRDFGDYVVESAFGGWWIDSVMAYLKGVEELFEYLPELTEMTG